MYLIPMTLDVSVPQSGKAYAENKWTKTITCSKSAASTLTYAIKVTLMPTSLCSVSKRDIQKTNIPRPLRVQS